MALANRKLTWSQSTAFSDSENSSRFRKMVSPFIIKEQPMVPATHPTRDNFPKGLRGGGDLVMQVCCDCICACCDQHIYSKCRKRRETQQIVNVPNQSAVPGSNAPVTVAPTAPSQFPYGQ